MDILKNPELNTRKSKLLYHIDAKITLCLFAVSVQTWELTLLTILYTVPYLASVVGGCSKKLADYCSCRCLSQQKEDDVMLIPSPDLHHSSISKAVCIIIRLWFDRMIFGVANPYLLSTDLHCGWWPHCLCIYQHIFHCWISMMISHQLCSNMSVRRSTLWHYQTSYISLFLFGMCGVNTKLCWWHACVDTELQKPENTIHCRAATYYYFHCQIIFQICQWEKENVNLFFLKIIKTA